MQKEVKFRSASKSDIQFLNQISFQSKKHWGYPDEWMEKWKDDLIISEEDLNRQVVTLIELNERVIGFSAVTESADAFEVTHLWIISDHIGQGYGKQLLKEALRPASGSGKQVVVEADPHAEAFYHSQGFRTFDKIESYPPGRYLPVMKLMA